MPIIYPCADPSLKIKCTYLDIATENINMLLDGYSIEHKNSACVHLLYILELLYKDIIHTHDGITYTRSKGVAADGSPSCIYNGMPDHIYTGCDLLKSHNVSLLRTNASKMLNPNITREYNIKNAMYFSSTNTGTINFVDSFKQYFVGGRYVDDRIDIPVNDVERLKSFVLNLHCAMTGIVEKPDNISDRPVKLVDRLNKEKSILEDNLRRVTEEKEKLNNIIEVAENNIKSITEASKEISEELTELKKLYSILEEKDNDRMKISACTEEDKDLDLSTKEQVEGFISDSFSIKRSNSF